jgi:hypothetical protein
MAMTSGNAAATGINAAQQSAAEIKAECEKLKDDADNEDKKIQQVRTSPKAEIAHKATTVTASKTTCADQLSSTKPAYSSRSRLPRASRPQYAEGNKPGEASNMCPGKDGKPFQHGAQGFSSGCAHTEARLVEDLFKKEGQAGAKNCELVIKIKWKQRELIKDPQTQAVTGARDLPPKDVACKEFCERVLCHAQHCGLKVFLCTDKGEKVPPKNCKKHGY